LGDSTLAGTESTEVFRADSAGATEIGTEAWRGQSVLGLQLAEGQRPRVIGEACDVHVAGGLGKAPPLQKSGMNSVLTKFGSPPQSWLNLGSGTGEYVASLSSRKKKVKRGGFAGAGATKTPCLLS
jgi:hypothetical protein